MEREISSFLNKVNSIGPLLLKSGKEINEKDRKEIIEALEEENSVYSGDETE
jgi:hypothetical protein